MYSFDSRIRYSEVDHNGKLTLLSLLNYFQDCSTFQSEDLGLGIEYMEKQGKIWVLSTWQIVVEEYPSLGERVKVCTVPYDFRGFLGYRNFGLMDENGRFYAKANSLWTLITADTFKPTRATQEMINGFQVGERFDMDYTHRRIHTEGTGFLADPVVIKAHHLDTNNHVNNGQYVAVAMDYLPKDYKIRQMRAEYKKQAYLNDVFHPYVEEQKGAIVVSLNDAEGYPYAVVEFQNGESNA